MTARVKQAFLPFFWSFFFGFSLICFWFSFWFSLIFDLSLLLWGAWFHLQPGPSLVRTCALSFVAFTYAPSRMVADAQPWRPWLANRPWDRPWPGPTWPGSACLADLACDELAGVVKKRASNLNWIWIEFELNLKEWNEWIEFNKINKEEERKEKKRKESRATPGLCWPDFFVVFNKPTLRSTSLPGSPADFLLL